jgi:hypothetical protein
MTSLFHILIASFFVLSAKGGEVRDFPPPKAAKWKQSTTAAGEKESPPIYTTVVKSGNDWCATTEIRGLKLIAGELDGVFYASNGPDVSAIELFLLSYEMRKKHLAGSKKSKGLRVFEGKVAEGKAWMAVYFDEAINAPRKVVSELPGMNAPLTVNFTEFQTIEQTKASRIVRETLRALPRAKRVK